MAILLSLPDKVIALITSCANLHDHTATALTCSRLFAICTKKLGASPVIVSLGVRLGTGSRSKVMRSCESTQFFRDQCIKPSQRGIALQNERSAAVRRVIENTLFDQSCKETKNNSDSDSDNDDTDDTKYSNVEHMYDSDEYDDEDEDDIKELQTLRDKEWSQSSWAKPPMKKPVLLTSLQPQHLTVMWPFTTFFKTKEDQGYELMSKIVSPRLKSLVIYLSPFVDVYQPFDHDAIEQNFIGATNLTSLALQTAETTFMNKADMVKHEKLFFSGSLSNEKKYITGIETT